MAEEVAKAGAEDAERRGRGAVGDLLAELIIDTVGVVVHLQGLQGQGADHLAEAGAGDVGAGVDLEMEQR